MGYEADAPAEFRGSFNPMASVLPGCQVSEHLPFSAKIMDRVSLLKSCTHPDAGHESATHMLLTGYKPTNDIPSNEAPSYGSIVNKELGPRTPGFPGYVALPQGPRSSAAAYLGVANNPFETRDNADREGFSVRNLKLPGVTMEQFEKRLSLLKRFDHLRRDVDSSGLIEGMDAFTQQAWSMVTSPQVQEAFDMGKEDPKTRELYGNHRWGRTCCWPGGWWKPASDLSRWTWVAGTRTMRISRV